MKKHPGPLIAAGCCFAAALLLRFGAVGFSFSAWLFAAAGAVVLLYLLLSARRMRKLRTALTVLLCLSALGFSVFELQVVLASDGDAGPGCDYVIVLGAAVNGETPSVSMLERLDAARSYLEDNPGCTAVVSGGRGPGESISEAEAMRVWLESHGISADRIIKEDGSSDTEENLRNSLAIIGARGGGGIAVVSSEYHLCRAERIAGLLGAAVSGIPARTEYFFLRLNYFIREGFGIAYITVFGI